MRENKKWNTGLPDNTNVFQLSLDNQKVKMDCACPSSQVQCLGLLMYTMVRISPGQILYIYIYQIYVNLTGVKDGSYSLYGCWEPNLDI